jgi:hypothetical protein
MGVRQDLWDGVRLKYASSTESRESSSGRRGERPFRSWDPKERRWTYAVWAFQNFTSSAESRESAASALREGRLLRGQDPKSGCVPVMTAAVDHGQLLYGSVCTSRDSVVSDAQVPCPSLPDRKVKERVVEAVSESRSWLLVLNWRMRCPCSGVHEPIQ